MDFKKRVRELCEQETDKDQIIKNYVDKISEKTVNAYYDNNVDYLYHSQASEEELEEYDGMPDEWYSSVIGYEAEEETLLNLINDAVKALGKNFDADIFTELVLKKFSFLDV